MMLSRVARTLVCALAVMGVFVVVGADSAAAADKITFLGPYTITLHQGQTATPAPVLEWLNPTDRAPNGDVWTPSGGPYVEEHVTISGNAEGLHLRLVAPEPPKAGSGHIEIGATPKHAGTVMVTVKTEVVPACAIRLPPFSCTPGPGEVIVGSHTYKIVTKPLGIAIVATNPAATSIAGGVHAPVPWHFRVEGLPNGYELQGISLEGTTPNGLEKALGLKKDPFELEPDWYAVNGSPGEGTEGTYKFEAVAKANQTGCSPCGPELTAREKLSLVVEPEAKKLKIEPSASAIALLGATHTPYPGTVFRASGSHTNCYQMRVIPEKTPNGTDPTDHMTFTPASSQLEWTQCKAFGEEMAITLTGTPDAAGVFPFSIEVAESGCETQSGQSGVCPKAVKRPYKLTVVGGAEDTVSLATDAGPLNVQTNVALGGQGMHLTLYGGVFSGVENVVCTQQRFEGNLSGPGQGNPVKLAFPSSVFRGSVGAEEKCEIENFQDVGVSVKTNQTPSTPWILEVAAPTVKSVNATSAAAIVPAGPKLELNISGCIYTSASVKGTIAPGFAQLEIPKETPSGALASLWKLKTGASSECPEAAQIYGSLELATKPAQGQGEQLQLIG